MGCCSSSPESKMLVIKNKNSIIESLRNMKCCGKMLDSELKQAAGVFALGTVAEGQVIFREGEHADCFYIVGKLLVFGEVEIVQ